MNNENFHCQKVHQNDKIIKRIQMNPEGKVVLVLEDRSLKILQINWEKEEVENV